MAVALPGVDSLVVLDLRELVQRYAVRGKPGSGRVAQGLTTAPLAPLRGYLVARFAHTPEIVTDRVDPSQAHGEVIRSAERVGAELASPTEGLGVGVGGQGPRAEAKRARGSSLWAAPLIRWVSGGTM